MAPVKMKSALVGSFYQEKAKKSEAEGKKLKTLLITKKQVINLKAVGWSRFRGTPKRVTTLLMKEGTGRVNPPSN